MSRRTGLAFATGAALVLIAVTVSSLITGESEPQAVPKTAKPQAVPKSARNGLVAYSYEGDIYVGDPVTGETTPIVTHAEYEVNPMFSPDGTRIAFIRGDPQTGAATIVVVGADGSDERVVLPRGRKHRGFGSLAWTPDGDSLLVQLDTPPFIYPYDGELSLFDSSGTGKERLLTPPLPPSGGGHYFNSSTHVAPMFRPPMGNRIVSGDRNVLNVFHSDLTTATRLGHEVFERHGPYVPLWPTWSADGARLAFGLLVLKEEATRVETQRDGLFLMSATGEGLRRIGDSDAGSWQWSPAGSRIAFQRVPGEADRAVIVILDADTGKERALESTSAMGKDAGARFSTVTYNNVVHHWYYEGWMWSPDGRSLLVLEDHRTRPWLVDIATDTATELPWLADSMPSWQRVERD